MEHTLGNLRVNPVLAELEKDKSLLTRQEFICEFENTEPMVIKVSVYHGSAEPENLIGSTSIKVETLTVQENQQLWYDLYNGSKVAGRVMIRFRFDEENEEDMSPSIFDKGAMKSQSMSDRRKKRQSEEILYKITIDDQDSKHVVSLVD